MGCKIRGELKYMMTKHKNCEGIQWNPDVLKFLYFFVLDYVIVYVMIYNILYH